MSSNSSFIIETINPLDTGIHPREAISPGDFVLIVRTTAGNDFYILMTKHNLIHCLRTGCQVIGHGYVVETLSKAVVVALELAPNA